MSVFKSMLGKKKEKAPSTEDAIQKILEVQDALGKKSQYLEKKVTDELEIAKKNGTKNKRVALAALKRKKRYEAQLNQIDGTLTTLDYQREVLENAHSNSEVLKAMMDANKAFKHANKDYNIDKVHDLMDDLSEQQQIAGEISSAISNPVGFDQDVDEDELLRELQELQDEELNSEILNIPDAPSNNLPQTSGKVKPPANKSKKSDLDELAAWSTG